MPLPKRRRSSSKIGKRRSHQRLKSPQFVPCPQCNEPKLPHYACTKCGFYKDRIVLKIKET